MSEFEINGYDADIMPNGNLRVGCHEIPRQEAEPLARTYMERVPEFTPRQLTVGDAHVPGWGGNGGAGTPWEVTIARFDGRVQLQVGGWVIANLHDNGTFEMAPTGGSDGSAESHPFTKAALRAPRIRR